MVAYSRIRSLTGSIQADAIPVLGAALSGTLAAATVLVMPTWRLESLAWSSGITALIPAAEPPLGTTARAVLSLGGGAVAAALVWAALYLLFGQGGYFHTPEGSADGAPLVRRADAHPDAPPRRPMSAADLGTPLMEVTAATDRPPSVVEAILPVERAVPTDLDQRLSAFDPAAIPVETPPEPLPIVAAPRPERPMAPPPALAPGERIETFDLSPVIRFGDQPEAEPRVTPSLGDLLARLEQGAERRAIRSAAGGTMRGATSG